MKDLRHALPSSTIEDTDNTSKANTSSNRNVDAETIENNPKIDAQLVSDFYYLVEASQGIIQSRKGANYNLSHPLDSKVVPTTHPDQDSSQIKKNPSETKKIEY